MKRINIHVEGEGEIRFLSILLFKHFGFEFNFIRKGELNMAFKNTQLRIELRPYTEDKKSGGFDPKKLGRLLRFLKVDSVPKKETNILILDADTKEHKPAGGFARRNKYLKDLRKGFGFDFQFFLIPDNSSDGNLEDLLEGLIASKGQPFYDCLKSYTRCLSILPKENIPIELLGKDIKKEFKKITFDWYTFNMVGHKKRNETSISKRDYSIEDIWNLEDESLKPLLDFLRSNF